ncbi:hypothetical protein GCM10007112_06450 [Vulcanisaeta souniana JCM 11219]|uniref:DUF1641 domain-containing protein n=1 Tax=Vulcanisaeta souniana JCM 11219 TaxID=1293586 RepID=A0A830E5I2_9CREN|nr:hypothetical protein GCM10007112_06450 [Vulcanisaeta souniana JCM 11219]
MAQAQQTQVEKSPDEQIAEALNVLVQNIDEVRGLLDQLIELKRSGVIDALMMIVNRFEEVLQYLFQDPAVLRLLSILIDGSLQAMNKLDAQDVIRLKGLVQDLGGCLGKNIDIANAKPIGLMGLWSALGDKDIQKGLGVTMAILKALGKCSSSK